MRGDICTMWRVCAKWLQVDDGNGDGDGNVGVDGLVDRSIMQCMYARDFKGAAGCTRMRFKQYNCWGGDVEDTEEAEEGARCGNACVCERPREEGQTP